MSSDLLVCGEKAPALALTSRGHGQTLRRSDVAQGTCSIFGCTTPVKARGWCSRHYWRWSRHGDPLWQPPTPSERFWKNVDKNGPGGCWLWTASLYGEGYGQFMVDRRAILTHRFAYLELAGPIPAGLVLDHLCRVRRCCNPAHLEPVTNRVNVLRGETVPADNAQKTHCPQGHPYDEVNTYVTRCGRRKCRTCRSEQKRRNRRSPEQRTEQGRRAANARWHPAALEAARGQQ